MVIAGPLGRAEAQAGTEVLPAWRPCLGLGGGCRHNRTLRVEYSKRRAQLSLAQPLIGVVTGARPMRVGEDRMQLVLSTARLSIGQAGGGAAVGGLVTWEQ